VTVKELIVELLKVPQDAECVEVWDTPDHRVIIDTLSCWDGEGNLVDYKLDPTKVKKVMF